MLVLAVLGCYLKFVFLAIFVDKPNPLWNAIFPPITSSPPPPPRWKISSPKNNPSKKPFWTNVSPGLIIIGIFSLLCCTIQFSGNQTCNFRSFSCYELGQFEISHSVTAWITGLPLRFCAPTPVFLKNVGYPWCFAHLTKVSDTCGSFWNTAGALNYCLRKTKESQ